MRLPAFCLLGLLVAAGALWAQSPMPVVVPAMTPAAASTAPATPDDGSLQAVVKQLQEMKTANEETLRKQEATLQLLDEVEKAANEIKIYTKRS
jgi:hypothetical protein